MEDVRALVTLGRSAREDAGIRVRQPLPGIQATLPGGRRLSGAMNEILRDELNVREVVFPAADADIVGCLPSRTSVGWSTGLEIGHRPWPALSGISMRTSMRCETERAWRPCWTREASRIRPEDVRIVEEAGELTVRTDGGYVVGSTRTSRKSCWRRGWHAEVMSRVQRLRREAGLEVSDRIRLAVAGSEYEQPSGLTGIGSGATLALEVETGAGATDGLEHVQDLEINGERLTVALSRIGQASNDS